LAPYVAVHNAACHTKQKAQMFSAIYPAETQASSNFTMQSNDRSVQQHGEILCKSCLAKR